MSIKLINIDGPENTWPDQTIDLNLRTTFQHSPPNGPSGKYEPVSTANYYHIVLSPKTKITAANFHFPIRKIKELFEAGEHLHKIGHYDLARMFFDRLISKKYILTKNNEHAFLLGRALAMIGESAKAIDIYKNIINSSNDQHTVEKANLELAMLYKSLFMPEAAMDRIKYLNHDDPRVSIILYECLRDMGNVSEAQLIIKKFMILSSNEAYVKDGLKGVDVDLARARFFYEAGECSTAEEICWKYVENPEYQYKSLLMLKDIYSKNNNYQGLEKILGLFKKYEHIYDYYDVRQMITLGELHKTYEKPDNSGLKRLKQELQLYSEISAKMRMLRIKYFPTPKNIYTSFLLRLGHNGYIPKEEVHKLMSNVPKTLVRFSNIMKKFYFIQEMHRAAASGTVQKIGEYNLKYAELSRFISPSFDGKVSEFASVMNTENLYMDIPKYYTNNSGEILKIIGSFTKKQIEKMPAREAIYLIAKATEQIIGKYGENRFADNDLPLELKIKRGDFRTGTCRDYTAMFILFFNEFKKINLNLKGFYVFADILPRHTFPTIFSVRGNNILFTSIDPSADDLTEKFADYIEPNIIRHFKLFSFLREEVSQKNYDTAWSFLIANFKRAKSLNYLKKIYFTYFNILKKCLVPESEYRKSLKKMLSYANSLPNSHKFKTILSVLTCEMTAKCGEKFKSMKRK